MLYIMASSMFLMLIIGFNVYRSPDLFKVALLPFFLYVTASSLIDMNLPNGGHQLIQIMLSWLPVLLAKSMRLTKFNIYMSVCISLLCLINVGSFLLLILTGYQGGYQSVLIAGVMSFTGVTVMLGGNKIANTCEGIRIFGHGESDIKRNKFLT